MFSKPRFLILTGIVLTAALARLLPHPWNVTPISAMALFAGSHFQKKWQAFLIPMVTLFISDLILGFHSGMPFVYGSFALIVALGFLLQDRKNILPVAGVTLCGSTLFYLITNFGSWLAMPMYPKTIPGLLSAYVLGLPFYRNMILGDLFYVALLFGVFHYAELTFPRLRASSAPHAQSV